MADNQYGRQWGGSVLSAALRLRLVSVVVLLSISSYGCVGPGIKSPELLQKYFPDHSPESSLVGMIFAIETSSWNIAYSRLSKNSQEKISPFKFKYGLALVKDPRTGISILNIITGSITDRTLLPRLPGQPASIERIQVNYYGKDSQGRLAAYFVIVYLVDQREEGAEHPSWKVDLLKSAENISGAGA